jgi:hypothetical protein
MRISAALLSSTILWSLPSCRSTEQTAGSSAPSAAPEASNSSSTLRLGQAAELPDFRIKFVSQRDCEARVVARARGGYRAWAVELEVTNTSSRRLAVNPFFATLTDDDRFSYTTTLIGCDPLLPARLLEPKETVRGFVPYALPNATTLVTLSYRPVLTSDRREEAKFRVEL